MKKTTLFFDMFNTLAEPHNGVKHLAYEALGISGGEWDRALWEPSLELDRALGRVRSGREIMERAFGHAPYSFTAAQLDAALAAHTERMRLALCDLMPGILSTLARLKEDGFTLGIISDADVIDIAGWNVSPLKSFMDIAVFSCDAGVKKPDPAIYALAMERAGCSAEEAVFIGDGGSDELMGAKRCGMTTVRAEHLLRRDEAKRQELDAWSDYVLGRFPDLKEMLKAMQ